MAFREHLNNKEKKKPSSLSPKQKKLSKEVKRNSKPTVPAVPAEFKPQAVSDLNITEA
ncbi:MAG: hypothetical protein WCC58_02775 [Burkholderiales bacterium]